MNFTDRDFFLLYSGRLNEPGDARSAQKLQSASQFIRSNFSKLKLLIS